MNRFSTICCLLLFVAIALPAGSDQLPQPNAQLHIVAQSVQYDLEGKLFTAEGQVQITYGDTLLNADNVEGNPDTGEIHATGHVLFKSKEQNLTAAAFNYNYKTEDGSAHDANAKAGPLFFSGPDLKTEPGKYILKGSTFTGCNAKKPHYYMIAKEMTIEPGKQLVAKRVSFVFLGKTLLTVPSYKYSLNPAKAGAQDPPALGASGKYGIFIGDQFDLSQGTDTVGLVDLRLSTKQVLQIGMTYDEIAGKPVFARAGYRMPYYGGSRNDLLVTRLPEVGIRFNAGDVNKRLMLTHDQIDLYSAAVSALGRAAHPGRVNAIGELGLGEFLEDPTGVSSARGDARILTWLSPVPIFDKNTTISPGFMARTSFYTNGKHYGVLGGRLALGRKLGHYTAVEVTYATRTHYGSSPFLFDQIDLSNELDARVYFPMGPYTIGVGGRYDLIGHSLFDSDLSISRTFHCLTPKVMWNRRFSQFSVGMGVVSF